jgi:hypothetical protein
LAQSNRATNDGPKSIECLAWMRYHECATDRPPFEGARGLKGPSAAFSFGLGLVYILYLDESGNPDDPADRHFVLGGAAVFERSTHFLSSALDGIQAKHLPGLEPIDFHAVEMRSGRGFWRGIEKEKREIILREVTEAIASANHPGVVLFAAVIEKSERLYGEDAVKHATEEVCRRFDIFLTRRFREHNDPQRGLVVFAGSSYEKRARLWVRGFRELGTQWGAIHNLSDIPYFAQARETRLLQAADMIAHGVFLLYERRNASIISPLIRRFDAREGVIHGLVHVTANKDTCECPRCSSNRTPDNLGPWIVLAPGALKEHELP